MSYQKYAELISKKFIRNHEESERILKFFFEKISEDLALDERVYFRGFGSFKKVTRPPRKYRNFITNKIEIRPAIKDIEFNPSENLLNNIKNK
ncbi:MAG: hypothetical protein B6I30_10180 [Desulfobacteraceae bacterium 4572_187]|nr:MAG: hypothetical protein B6I30_10180 [Desulfobacteraceae bacterium 4572_187]